MTGDFVTILLIAMLVMALVLIVIVTVKLFESRIRKNQLIQETVELNDDMTNKSWTKSPIVYVGGKEPNSSLIEEAPLTPKLHKADGARITITESKPPMKRSAIALAPAVNRKKPRISIAEIGEGRRVIGADVRVTEAEAPVTSRVKEKPTSSVRITESYPVKPMDMRSDDFVITEVEGAIPENGIIRKPARIPAKKKTAINVEEYYADDSSMISDSDFEGEDYVVSTNAISSKGGTRISMAAIASDRVRRGVNINVSEEHTDEIVESIIATSDTVTTAKADSRKVAAPIVLTPPKKKSAEKIIVVEEIAPALPIEEEPEEAVIPVSVATKRIPENIYISERGEVKTDKAATSITVSEKEQANSGPITVTYGKAVPEAYVTTSKLKNATVVESEPAVKPVANAPKAQTKTNVVTTKANPIIISASDVLQNESEKETVVKEDAVNPIVVSAMKEDAVAKAERAEEPASPEIAPMHPVSEDDEEIVFTEIAPEPEAVPEAAVEEAVIDEDAPVAPIAPIEPVAEPAARVPKYTQSYTTPATSESPRAKSSLKSETAASAPEQLLPPEAFVIDSEALGIEMPEQTEADGE